MFFGRVITTNKRLVVPEYIEKVSSIKEIVDEIPTIVIGKENAINFFGKDKIKVLDRHINKHTTWTYSKTEKRDVYEQDLHKFFENCIKNNIKNVKYFNFNFLKEPLSKTKRLIKYLKNDEPKVVYLNEKHIYIYSNKSVVGIPMQYLDFLGIKDKTLKNILNNKNNVFIDSDFSKKMCKTLKANEEYTIPYIYFMTKMS